MFDRFILASDFKRIEARYSMAKLPELVSYVPSYNIGDGDSTYIINNSQTKEILQFEFGMKGLGAIQPFIRAEGDRNVDDDPQYSGSKALFLKPGINHIIRTQRCLVLADAFVVGSEGDNPYLIYLRHKQRPFSFAGIWNKTMNKQSGEEEYSYAIITTVANQLMQKLGMKRMPVILSSESENTWLRKKSELFEILWMLNPYPHTLMNANPISSRISDKNINDISLVQPTGKPIYNENPVIKKMPRLGKTGNENKVHYTLAEIAENTRLQNSK